MTEETEINVAAYLHKLINGNQENLIVAPNTTLNFSIKRIYAHRFFSNTLCYGMFLANNWAQELVIKYKKPGKVDYKLRFSDENDVPVPRAAVIDDILFVTTEDGFTRYDVLEMNARADLDGGDLPGEAP